MGGRNPDSQELRKLKKLLAVLFVNFLIFFAGVLILEAFFGNWWKQNPLIRLNIPRDQKLWIDTSYFFYSEKPIFYKRDAYGFRGNYPDVSKIDILTVGGSTTAQTYIGEGQTWQDVIAADFKKDGKTVYLANAGLEGQTSYGHIRNFQLWFSRIPNLRPKYVLVYVGINDMGLKPSDYGDVLEEKPSRLALFKRRSALYLIYRVLLGWYWKNVTRAYRYQPDIVDQIVWTDKPMLEHHEKIFLPYVKSYERRLKYLIREIQKIGARPIFVTQVTRGFKFAEGKVWGDEGVGTIDKFKMNGVDEYHMLNLMNQALLRICRKVNGICIDLANGLTFKKPDFYDLEHNTALGTAKIGHYLYEKLKPYF